MTPRTVAFHPAAADEFVLALAWYDDQRAGLGDELSSEVRLVTVSLEEHADALPIAHDSPPSEDVRQARVHRFPYRLVFFVDGSFVRVVAVAHLRRRPGYWRHRLTSA